MLKDIEQLSESITEKIAKISLKFYRSRKFRLLSGIDKMDQVEKDRIFNEIVISGVALAVLMFDTVAEQADFQNRQQYFRQLSLELNNRYGNWLMEIGADKENAELFKKVIRMRTDEYRTYYNKYKKKVGKKKKVNVWIPIVTTGGFFHITRGKPKDDSKNSYFLFFRDFIGNLSIVIIKSVI